MAGPNDHLAAVKPTLRGIVQNPMYFMAFGFGSGLSPFAPGTAGTAAAIPLFWLFLVGLTPIQYLIATTVVSVAGIYICQRTTDWLRVHDHGGIVWDEFAGFLIGMIPVVFLAANHTGPIGLETEVGAWPMWLWIVVGFFVFRIFDVLKPFPIGMVDKQVDGGLGIMIDDVLAGLDTAVVMYAIHLQQAGRLF
jgi:phosphatidylglycerophosphatase A